MNVPVLPPRSIGSLPTMHDLPSDHPEDPGLPDEFHGLQPQILSETLKLSGYTPMERFNAFDLNLYYDPNHTRWYKRPDWFLVVGTTRMYRGQSSLRSSYVVWDEGVAPIVVVEFLSPGTESEDLGRFASKPIKPNPKSNQPPGKFTVYEEILKIPNYIVFDEATRRLWFFRLVNDRYQEQPISITNPLLWIPELEVGLTLERGEYRESLQFWLRWCDASGNLFPTLEETTQAAKEAADAADAAAQAADASAQAAAAAAQAAIAQNRQAIVNLLATGMSPEHVAAAFGMAIDDLPT